MPLGPHAPGRICWVQVLGVLLLLVLHLEAESAESGYSSEADGAESDSSDDSSTYDELSPALIEPFSVSIRCPTNQTFNWERADDSGMDIVMYYTCGNSGQMSQTVHCTNGYKASFRRDLIPEAMKRAAIPIAVKRGFITADDDPSFGVFSSGPDFRRKNGAVVVFSCVNVN